MQIRGFYWSLPLILWIFISGIAPAAPSPLSEAPSDTDIRTIRTFPRQLLPVDAPPSQGLAAKIGSLIKRTDAPPPDAKADGRTLRSLLVAMNDPGCDRRKLLDSFVKANPDSRWTPGLRLELAAMEYREGRFLHATEHWEKIWTDFHASTDPAAVSLSDEAIKNLLETYMALGDADRLATLIGEQEGRPGNAAVEEALWRAKKVDWLLRHIPAQSVMCGPNSLYAILRFQHKTFTPVKLNQVSADKIATGLSLADLKQYADGFGLSMQMVRRTSPDAEIPTPAILHWSRGHYATLLARDGTRYFVEDRSFRFTGWVESDTLDEVASGWFLIPQGTIPAGWAVASAEEGARVFGRDGAHGQVPSEEAVNDNNLTTGDDELCTACGCKGMPKYSFHPQVAALRIEDTPLGYTPPVGPALAFRLAYLDMDSGAPASELNIANAGRVWNVSLIAFVYHVGGVLLNGQTLRVRMPGGGTETYTYDQATGRFGPQDQSFATIIRTGANSNRYERTLPDGSREIYDKPDDPTSPTRILLTQRIDPAGNAMTFNYDANLRLTNVVDAIGQTTTLAYTNLFDIWKITSITDPFGRTAFLRYNQYDELAEVEDVAGMISRFDYGFSEFITNMVTPYGTTRFEKATDMSTWNRTITATDPEGDCERIQYAEPITVPEGFMKVILPSTIRAGAVGVYFQAEHGRMEYRNSFYWNKKAMREGAGDFTKARNYRWFSNATGGALVTPALEGIKEPLQERVWINYPNLGLAFGGDYSGGPQRPSKIARAIGEDKFQIQQSYYNALGLVTNAIDPLGRETVSTYATNQMDLIEVRQKNGAATDLLFQATYNAQHLPIQVTDAGGATTRFAYNSRGQVTAVTNTLGEAVTYEYNLSGYLTAVDGPLPGAADRATQTYDAFGRVASTTRPDGYTIAYQYDALDRLTRATYPDGTYTESVYNRLDVASRRDRQGRWTYYTYNNRGDLTETRDPLDRITRYSWCKCGALDAVYDPNGQVTRFERDVQNRVTARFNADGTAVRFDYDPISGWLRSVTDEDGNIRVMDYNVDGTLKSERYTGPRPAPAVEYAYDPFYLRLTNRSDGVGATHYAYWPVGQPGGNQLALQDGPLTNDDVVYQYDLLGRMTNRMIGDSGRAFAYDVLGRVATEINPLGTFQFGYDGAMSRLASVAYPNGQTSIYHYADNLGDFRLQEIDNRRSNGAELSRFGYAYNGEGDVGVWTQSVDGVSTSVWSIGYDADRQLTSAVVRVGGTVDVDYAWTYDAAGNRLSERRNSETRVFAYNALNQLASISPGAGPAVTNEWDAAQRLVKRQWNATNELRLAHDGANLPVGLTDVSGSVTNRDVRFVWCDGELSEERDATGAQVTKRFFPWGVQVLSGSVTGSFFYAADHLGSIRELTDSAGAIRARYAYDAWGNRVRTQGDLEADFGFTGHLFDPRTGLYLAPRRQYDASIGRWLSRDPVRSTTRASLYQYCFNNPVNDYDSDGEKPLRAVTWGSEVEYDVKVDNGCPCDTSIQGFIRDLDILAGGGSPPEVMYVIKIKGMVHFKGSFHVHWKPMSRGKMLYSGNTIRLGPSATVKILRPGGYWQVSNPTASPITFDAVEMGSEDEGDLLRECRQKGLTIKAGSESDLLRELRRWLGPHYSPFGPRFTMGGARG